MHRKGLVQVAAAAALACAGWATTAQADVPDQPIADAAPPTVQPLYLQDAPARTPLMAGLDSLGLAKPLDDLGIKVYGRVEGSYTYGFSSPPGNVITGRVFDFEHEDLTLNQVGLVIEKTVDDAIREKRFDVGARVEWIYGGDSRLIHSVGLFDHQGVGDGPETQWDLNQAYVDVAVPVGNGLRLRLGKFVTLLGQEVIDPTGNTLYSHSYLFGFAIPFTHTGVMASYNINDQLAIDAAVTRGWDTSLEDNNGTVDFLGRVTYKFDDRTTALVSLVTGPDQPGDNDNWRTVVDLILLHKVSDDFSIGLNADYGYEENSVTSVAGSAAQWYGVAGYASYTLCDSAKLNLRGEYFNDDDGARLTAGVGGTSVWEATVGLAITPFPNEKYLNNLTIRPEIRYDYANKAFFDAGTEHSQFTAAVDAIFTF